MKDLEQLLQLVVCPGCGSDQIESKGTSQNWQCSQCERSYPILEGIPWLFKDAANQVAEWQNRYNFQLQTLERDIELLKLELKDTNLAGSTQKRLRALIQAKTEQIREITKVMAPLQINGQGTYNQSVATQVELPKSQALMSYYDNVCRDWSYGEEENQRCEQELLELIGKDRKLGTFVSFGAGACRLPYDLHRSCETELSVAVDINPYLLYLGKRAISGKSMTLYEFPMAPINLDSFAVKLRGKAPEPINKGFTYLMSDAMTPAFRDESVDTLLTPWLIDIVHQDAATFFARLNQVLKPGGRWLNFGSLSFFHARSAICYSLEEIFELVEAAGFVLEGHRHEFLPYLHSPYSAQRRLEKVLSFSARKIRSVAKPEADYQLLPDWLKDRSQPIPLLPAFNEQLMVQRTLSNIFDKIDGSRSLQELAAIVSQDMQIPVPNTEQMLFGLLNKFYQDRLKGRQF